MRKVLIANRGEIAVRIVRACRDAGLVSVAVYADTDLDALHVTMADEAYALEGQSAGRQLPEHREDPQAGRRRRAPTRSTPGTGSWPRTRRFARAVIDAGLTWIGPPPAAIDALGDKVAARRIAQEVGAPLAPGTDGPVSGVDEVTAFAARHGLPVAIKAAFGGGGRGLKVVHVRGGDRRDVRVRGPGGGRRVRPRRVLRGALPGAPAARGDPVPGRPARRRGRGVHPGLLAPAASPEAGRGGARPVPDREQETLLYEASKAIMRRAGLRRRGHLRVPRRPGRHRSRSWR